MNSKLSKFILLILGLGLLGCQSLLSRKDYQETRIAWEEGNSKKAIQEFPKGERGSFITTLEKAHLGFFAGKRKFESLKQVSEQSQERIRFSATKELEDFFYIETPEGYYASEHEIIYMHILLGLYYSRIGDYENAAVEAKIASNLLQGQWSASGHFDDATMRLLLASLWTSCGKWNEARVDLRAASGLSNLPWAARLADQKSPPKHLLIVFGGPGPEPSMDPEIHANFIRGLRNLDFSFVGQRSSLFYSTGNSEWYPLEISPSTENWYKRHLVRNNEAHEIIQDSKYFERAMAVTIKDTGIITAEVIGGVALAGSLVVVGGVVAYYASQVYFQAGAVGIAIAIAGIDLGYKLVKKGIKKQAEKYKKEMDLSNHYRYARFLPEYVWFGETNLPDNEIEIKTQFGKPMRLPATFGKIPVTIGYYQDTTIQTGY